MNRTVITPDVRASPGQQRRVGRLLHSKAGDSAVSFIFTCAMLVLVFAMLISALVYVMQYFSAGYACRRIVREVEMSGQYNAAQIRSMAYELTGDSLTGVAVSVDATFLSRQRIQLRQPFSVTLSARYRIAIFRMGNNPVYVNLPIHVTISGMSEVYWR